MKHLRFDYGVVAGVLLLSACLNLYNNGFSPEFHRDEQKKVSFVLSGRQDFNHPILMLQAVRAANWFFNYTTEDALIILGRSMTAVFGTALVLLVYLLARTSMRENYARLTALGVAVSPLVVVHSHYLKEDIYFTACSYLSLFALFFMLKKKTPYAVALFGVAIGLALSAQYKGVLLLPFYLLVPLLSDEVKPAWFYRRFLCALLVALAVVLMINYPALVDPDVFVRGIAYESKHIQSGHTLAIDPLPHYFSFHLVNSIIPGITPPVTALALLGMAITVWSWRREILFDRVLLLYVLIFYFAHEITPMKAAPGFIRYMIPIAPALLYFCVKALAWMAARIKAKGWPKTVAAGQALAVLAIVVLPGCDALLLDYYLVADTRLEAEQWIEESGKKAIFDSYSHVKHMTKFGNTRTRSVEDWTSTRSVADINLGFANYLGISYLVASSFEYERFLRGAKLAGQHPVVYQRAERYEALFSLPYHEIRPRHRSFAFSNPTIRIIDICATRECGQKSVLGAVATAPYRVRGGSLTTASGTR